MKGDEIPFLARILTVADAFDAMMSDRKYRSKLSLEETKEQFRLYSGTQFDPQVVEKLFEILENYDLMLEELSKTFT